MRNEEKKFFNFDNRLERLHGSLAGADFMKVSVPGKANQRGRLITVDLLVLTGLY
jgi:hypothetical protein